MFARRFGRFLKPLSPSASRLSPALCLTRYTKIAQKKPRPPSEPSGPTPAPLSPGQLDRIARNKRAALERLSAAQAPPGFGDGWRKALSAEFGKTYFKQVRVLVVSPHTASLC